MSDSTEDILKRIKREFRLMMNGVVSASMRERGADYRLNFGLTLPLLKRVASHYEPDVDLAQKLWQEKVRESKMLAALLFPPAQFTMEIAKEWLADIQQYEIADICTMALFVQLSRAEDFAVDCLRAKEPVSQYVGYQLLNRLITQKSEQSALHLSFIITQALQSAASGELSVATAALNLLKRGLRIPQWNEKIRTEISPWLALPSDDKRNSIAREIEIEYTFWGE